MRAGLVTVFILLAWIALGVALVTWYIEHSQGISSTAQVKSLSDDFRDEVANNAMVQMVSVLKNAEGISRLNARNFKNGVFSFDASSSDPRSSAGTTAMMNAFLQQLWSMMTVTTVSVTTYRGLLFGVYNDFSFTFAGKWESFINSTSSNVDLVDYQIYNKGSQYEGQVKNTLGTTYNYDSSKQVWYTVAWTGAVGGEAWTPIYTMNVNGGVVTTMVSYSAATYDTSGNKLGVSTIDLALGFVNKILQDLPGQSDFSAFVVDTKASGGAVLLGSSNTSQPVSACQGTPMAGGTCNGNETFLSMTQVADANIKAVHNAVIQQFSAWSSASNTTVVVGTNTVSLKLITRNNLQWVLAVSVKTQNDNIFDNFMALSKPVLYSLYAAIGLQVAAFILSLLNCCCGSSRGGRPANKYHGRDDIGDLMMN